MAPVESVFARLGSLLADVARWSHLCFVFVLLRLAPNSMLGALSQKERYGLTAEEARAVQLDPHAYVAPKPGWSRAPCPALNALANHNYIARDGKAVSPQDLVRGLRAAYNLSAPLAYLLSYGGFYLFNNPIVHLPVFSASISKFWSNFSANHKILAAYPSDVVWLLRSTILHPRVALADFALHNHVEHDASLAHEDTFLAHAAHHPGQCDCVEEEEDEPLAFDVLSYPRAPTHAYTVDSLGLPSPPRSAPLRRSKTVDERKKPKDARHRRVFAPCAVHPDMFEAFVNDSRSGKWVDAKDIATARVRREDESKAAFTAYSAARQPHHHPFIPSRFSQNASSNDDGYDDLHAEIARGEAALVLGIFGSSLPGSSGPAVPLNFLRSFWLEERLPDGWKPSHQQTTRGTVKLSKDIRTAMIALRAARAAIADVAKPVMLSKQTSTSDLPAARVQKRIAPSAITIFDRAGWTSTVSSDNSISWPESEPNPLTNSELSDVTSPTIYVPSPSASIAAWPKDKQVIDGLLTTSPVTESPVPLKYQRSPRVSLLDGLPTLGSMEALPTHSGLPSSNTDEHSEEESVGDVSMEKWDGEHTLLGEGEETDVIAALKHGNATRRQAHGRRLRAGS